MIGGGQGVEGGAGGLSSTDVSNSPVSAQLNVGFTQVGDTGAASSL